MVILYNLVNNYTKKKAAPILVLPSMNGALRNELEVHNAYILKSLFTCFSDLVNNKLSRASTLSSFCSPAIFALF